jgi:hypothetical protein
MGKILTLKIIWCKFFFLFHSYSKDLQILVTFLNLQYTTVYCLDFKIMVSITLKGMSSLAQSFTPVLTTSSTVLNDQQQSRGARFPQRSGLVLSTSALGLVGQTLSPVLVQASSRLPFGMV